MEEDPAVAAEERVEVVHPVQAAQQRAFAASRGPDHPQDLVGADLEGDLLERGLTAVPDRVVVESEDRAHVDLSLRRIRERIRTATKLSAKVTVSRTKTVE